MSEKETATAKEVITKIFE